MLQVTFHLFFPRDFSSWSRLVAFLFLCVLHIPKMVFWDFPVVMTAHSVAWHIGTNSCVCLASLWFFWMVFAIISRPSCSAAYVRGLMYICHFDIPFMSVHRVPQFLLLVLRFFGPSACRAQKRQHRVCCAVVLSKLILAALCVCVLCVLVCVCVYVSKKWVHLVFPFLLIGCWL